jgi:hypothetical protein
MGEGVYFVTWVENRAVQAPPPGVNWDTYEPIWYGDHGDYEDYVARYSSVIILIVQGISVGVPEFIRRSPGHQCLYAAQPTVF